MIPMEAAIQQTYPDREEPAARAPRKIHIIGSTGSGKSYLAKQLSAKLRIPCFELDNAMWSRLKERPGKNPEDIRDALLGDMLNREAWIVEGVYHLWTSRCFQEADRIIFLAPHPYVRDMRIISRFLKQRTGLESSNYKQSFKGLIKMLRWNHKFERVIKAEILACLKPYEGKVMVLKSNKQKLDWGAKG